MKDQPLYIQVMHGIDIGYWNGPAPSPIQQENNLQTAFCIIEQFPNGILATRNPEYVEEYLKRVDLDLPPGISISPC